MGTKLSLVEADFSSATVDVRPSLDVEISIDALTYSSDQNISFSVMTSTIGYENVMPTVTFGGRTLFTQSEVSPWSYYVVLDETTIGAKDIVAKQAADSKTYKDGYDRVGVNINSIY